MSFLRFFNELPLEVAVEHLKYLSLRDLMRLWMTSKEIHTIINSDTPLLKKLGVSSFEEFIDRTNALLYYNTRDLKQLKKIQEMVLDGGLPLRTAELLISEDNLLLHQLFNDNEINLFCNLIDSERELFINGIKSGSYDGLLSAILEGFITKNEFIAEMESRRGDAPREFNEISHKIILFQHINGTNAFRAGLISMINLMQMDENTLRKWITSWITNESDCVTLFHRLQKHNEYTKKIDAKRLYALSGNLQVLVIENHTTIETAEEVTSILTNNPQPNLRQFNLADNELALLDKPFPGYPNDKTYNTYLMMFFSTIHQHVIDFSEVLAVALIDKLITIDSLKSLIDSYQEGPETKLYQLHQIFNRNQALIALKEGLITLSDFYHDGAFAPMIDDFHRLLKNDCKWLRKYEAFLKENWKLLGADQFQEAKKQFYSLPVFRQKIIYKHKIPFLAAEQARNAIGKLIEKSEKYDAIFENMTKKQTNELFITAWQEPEKLEEKLNQMDEINQSNKLSNKPFI